MCRRAY
ncbi:hypothetical protein LINPERHAP1_LOCUS40041 [Linum perenne]